MSDGTEMAIYVAAGAYVVPKLADMVASFFKGSVTRNIEAADKAQEKIENRVDRLDGDIEDLRREVTKLEGAHTAHKDAMNTALGHIDGRLQALDNRIAAQGKAYEERIDEGFRKLEIELNRKLAQVVNEVSSRRGRGRP